MPRYRRELGRCIAEFDGLWALTKRSVSQAARHGAPGAGAMVTKLAYSEARQRFGELCLRVLDRDALAIDGNELVEERLRTLALTIAAGASQIQRNIVSRARARAPEESRADGPRALRRPGRAARRHRRAARRSLRRRPHPRRASTARCGTSSPRPACSRSAPTASAGPTASSCSSSWARRACPARSSRAASRTALLDGVVGGIDRPHAGEIAIRRAPRPRSIISSCSTPTVSG